MPTNSSMYLRKNDITFLLPIEKNSNIISVSLAQLAGASNPGHFTFPQLNCVSSNH